MTTPKKILLATDLSCRCDRALDRAVMLASEWRARLVVVHALESPLPLEAASGRPIDFRRVAKRQVREDVSDAPIEIDVVVERGEPTALVLETAQRFGCELLVTGVARNETFGRAILGTTVENLARRSTVPVLVVKSRPRTPYMRIAAASDFSEGSRQALVTALDWFPSADVSLVHAYDVPYETFVGDPEAVRTSVARDARDQGKAFLEETKLPAGKHVSLVCEYGSPASLLHDLAVESKVDLVVAGMQGRSRVATLLLGSTAQDLLARVPRDILIVPRRV